MATGDKKRAVMTTDINNSGSDYPVMPLKTIDAVPDAAHTNNLITSAAVAAVADALQRKSNRNLLDNWYFVGGGSQQGGGQFPINQRGRTSYTGVNYGIDRWYGANIYGNIQIAATELVLNSLADAYFAIEQKINTPGKLNGRVVTVSALLSTGDVISGSAALNLTSADQTFIEVLTSSFILSVQGSTSSLSVRLRVQNNQSVRLIAVKLELGSEQTLAHQENGVWVLNEIPDYGTELMKCRASSADPSDTFANQSSGILTISVSGVSSLPRTISNPAIRTDHVVTKLVLSAPAAKIGDWTFNTNTAGQLVISGSIGAATDITELRLEPEGTVITGQ